MTHSIESYAAELNAKGITFQNLFQRTDGEWQCNLRTGAMAYEFGMGRSMIEAAMAAYMKLPGNAVRGTSPKTFSIGDVAEDPFDS